MPACPSNMNSVYSVPVIRRYPPTFQKRLMVRDPIDRSDVLARVAQTRVQEGDPCMDDGSGRPSLRVVTTQLSHEPRLTESASDLLISRSFLLSYARQWSRLRARSAKLAAAVAGLHTAHAQSSSHGRRQRAYPNHQQSKTRKARRQQARLERIGDHGGRPAHSQLHPKRRGKRKPRSGKAVSPGVVDPSR